MALIKEHTINGLTGNYWRVKSYTVDADIGKTRVTVYFHPTSNVRDEGDENKITVFSGIELDGELESYADVYDALKTVNMPWQEADEEGEMPDPFFDDAQDDV